MLDAIVVLGCAVRRDGRPGGALSRRIERALRAYRQYPGAVMLVSGGKRWHGVAEADAMLRALESRGVPSSAIVSERRSLTTVENARYTAELLSSRSPGRVFVVTCDWHMPRALACFRLAGVEAAALAAPSPPVARPWAALRALRERTRMLFTLYAGERSR